MKYCKKCRILYSDEAAACPKCGVSDEAAKAEEIAPVSSDKKRVGLDWLWLVIGIPVFIGLIYLFVYLLKSIG